MNHHVQSWHGTILQSSNSQIFKSSTLAIQTQKPPNAVGIETAQPFKPQKPSNAAGIQTGFSPRTAAGIETGFSPRTAAGIERRTSTSLSTSQRIAAQVALNEVKPRNGVAIET